MNPRGGIGCARPEVQGDGCGSGGVGRGEDGGAAPSLREERGRVLVLNTGSWDNAILVCGRLLSGHQRLGDD